MQDRYPGAFLVSLTLHTSIAGLMFLFAYAANLAKPETMKEFELVAGDGTEFAETKAPALGEPGGIKMELPKAPPPEVPKPREVASPEVTPPPVAPPVQEKPLPKPLPEKSLPKLPDAKSLEKKMDRVEQKTKAKIEKQREAEVKKLTKEEFDKANKAKASAAASPAPAKIAKLDPEGIRKGVVGGSTENTKGGAGGKALVREDGSLMEAYTALLQQRLRAALNKPAGLSETLVVKIHVRINADGSLTGARVVQSSGSEEFDAAAMNAVAATRMPPHPNKGEELTIPFKMKEQE